MAVSVVVLPPPQVVFMGNRRAFPRDLMYTLVVLRLSIFGQQTDERTHENMSNIVESIV